MYEDSLVLTVRRALLDPLPEVRKTAGDAFDKLHDTIAQKALDGILPYILHKLVSHLCLAPKFSFFILKFHCVQARPH